MHRVVALQQLARQQLARQQLAREWQVREWQVRLEQRLPPLRQLQQDAHQPGQ
jgi:hypothetical protein